MKPRSFIHAKQYVIKHTHIVPVNILPIQFFQVLICSIILKTVCSPSPKHTQIWDYCHRQHKSCPWCTNFPNGFSYQPILCQHVHFSQCNLYAILQSINCLDIVQTFMSRRSFQFKQNQLASFTRSYPVPQQHQLIIISCFVCHTYTLFQCVFVLDSTQRNRCIQSNLICTFVLLQL